LIWQHKIIARFLLFLLPALTLIACGNGDGSSPTAVAPPATIRTVTLTWNPNRETSVNTTGGGYKVYYSTNSGFNILDAGVSVVNVPFVAPPSAPTTTNLQLASGNYYFRVVAYSALNPPGGNSGSTSTPSNQIALTVP
jgi:hypothetical protein